LTIPPLQHVSELFRALLADRPNKDTRRSSQTPRSNGQPAAPGHSLRDELACLTSGVDPEDAQQVSQVKTAVVETILRFELNDRFADQAELARASDGNREGDFLGRRRTVLVKADRCRPIRPVAS